MTTQKPVGAEYREGRAAMFAAILDQLAVIAPRYADDGSPFNGVRDDLESIARRLRGGRE